MSNALIALMMVSQGADVGGEPAVVPVDGAVTEVFVMETPGHTSFAYLPHTISVRNDESGEVRSATIVSYNPRTQATRPGDQIGARSTMEFACARQSYREMRTVSQRMSGEQVEVVPANPARPFFQTRPGSYERLLADAICAVRL